MGKVLHEEGPDLIDARVSIDQAVTMEDPLGVGVADEDRFQAYNRILSAVSGPMPETARSFSRNDSTGSAAMASIRAA